MRKNFVFTFNANINLIDLTSIVSSNFIQTYAYFSHCTSTIFRDLRPLYIITVISKIYLRLGAYIPGKI